MSKTRKLLSVLVALAMLISTFALTVGAAAAYEDEDATFTQSWDLGTPVDNGDGTWSVDVMLTADYAVGAIQFQISNTDNAAVELVEGIPGDAMTDDYNASISVFNDTGIVSIIPEPTEDAAAGLDLAEGGVIVTLVFNVTGSATIAIIDDAKNADNPDGKLIALRMPDGVLTTGSPVAGQIVESVGSSQVIGASAAEAPTLGVIDGTIGVIDTARTVVGSEDYGTAEYVTGYIYGVEPENFETVDSVFEVVGDGSIEIVANAAGSEAGTGTLVNVIDTEGTVVETYCLIIFGDVNGDGMVSADDSINIELHDSYMYEEGLDGMQYCEAELLFAGDVTGDDFLSVDDSIDIELHDAYMYENGSDGMRLYQADVMAILGY